MADDADRDPDAGVHSITAIAPAGRAVVRFDVPLAQVHGAPGWLTALRLAVVVVAGLLLPLSALALAAALVGLWLATGWLLRYPVVLPAGRALFEGGLGNTSEPGRHWLRRRRTEQAHSIPLDPLALDWRPAPTRLEGDGVEGWLELELRARVRPRDDEAGQFLALMEYRGWSEFPALCARRLREELVDAVVEQLGRAGRLKPGPVRPATLDHEVRPALTEGLHALGLGVEAFEHVEVRLLPRTDDLGADDRVRLTRTMPELPARRS